MDVQITEALEIDLLKDEEPGRSAFPSSTMLKSLAFNRQANVASKQTGQRSDKPLSRPGSKRGGSTLAPEKVNKPPSLVFKKPAASSHSSLVHILYLPRQCHNEKNNSHKKITMEARVVYCEPVLSMYRWRVNTVPSRWKGPLVTNGLGFNPLAFLTSPLWEQKLPRAG